MPLIDITGQRFTRLVVLSYIGVVNRKPHWRCRCDCGTVLAVRGDSLKDRNTQSCGCLKLDSATTHGHSHSRPDKPPSRTYVTWQGMISRCMRPGSSGYERYGAVGIRVCDRWLSFTNFLADMGERPKGKTLDRLDISGHYEPGNCRWATPREQANNRRSNRLLTHAGVRRTIGEWATALGIPREVLQDRVRLGWANSRIVTTPYRARRS